MTKTYGKICNPYEWEELILMKYIYIQSNLQIQWTRYQNANSVFHKSRIKMPIFEWNHKQIHIESNFEKKKKKKKDKAGGTTISDFKIHCNDKNHKTSWYWHKHSYIDQ